MPSDECDTQPAVFSQKDLRWTLGGVYRGKTGWVFGIATGIVAILIVALFAINAKYATISVSLADILNALHSGNHAQDFAINIVPFIVLCALPVLILSLPVALVVKAVLDSRAEKTEATAETVGRHRREMEFSWSIAFSILLGLFDFCAVYYVCMSAIALVAPNWTIPVFLDSSFVLAALVVAELRIRRVNNVMLASKEDLAPLLDDVRAGRYDAEIPESLRNPLGVTRIVKMLDIGAARTVKGAVRYIKMYAIRDRLMHMSAFLCTAVQAFVVTVTFGYFTKIVIAVNDATRDMAVGAPTTKPHATPVRKHPASVLSFEMAAIILSVAFVVSALVISVGDYVDRATAPSAAVAQEVPGTWHGTTKATSDLSTYTYDYTALMDEDGTFTLRISREETDVGGSGDKLISYKGTWSVAGSTLTMKTTDGSGETFAFTLSGSGESMTSDDITQAFILRKADE